MGNRGPRPTPTAVRIARGNPSKRPINKREPKPDAARPRCPQWLDKDAKSAWRQLVPQLARMGVLTAIDRNALARYCVLWSRWKHAELFLQTHGSVYPLKNDDGTLKYMQQFPQVAIANKLATQLNRLEQEFGMTPSARSSLQVANPNTGNEPDLDEFLKFNRA